jgi:hypothetical protein
MPNSASGTQNGYDCAREGPVAFSVQDFHDPVRLLEERPEWRTELRRLVLSEELLRLPDVVAGLAEAPQRAEDRLSGVEAGHRSISEAAALARARGVWQLLDGGAVEPGSAA